MMQKAEQQELGVRRPKMPKARGAKKKKKENKTLGMDFRE
jgi:hypothetical protein